jgi:PAS domain S-box-containing protein
MSPTALRSVGAETTRSAAGPLPNLGTRVAPFAVAAALPFLLTLLFGPHAGSPQFIASGALTALLIVAALLVPWARVPPALRATVPLLYFVVVFLLRDSSVTAATVYTPLVLLPVIWLALYGSRGQLLFALACLALTLIIPILAIGSPRYRPSTEWRRVAVYLAIAPIVGLTIQRLVTEIRVRADRLTRSEAQTREGRDLLASVLRASTEYSIIGTDSAGVIRVFNEGAERMLGYRSAEMIGVHTLEVVHDPDEVAARAAQLGTPPGFEVFVAAARRGEAETRDWTYVRKDGGHVTVSLTITPIDGPGGRPAGFIGVARDVTTQRRVEQALRESEARHRLLVQNLPDTLISLYDRELRVLLAEGPMLARQGYTEDELLGRSLSELLPAEQLAKLEPLHRAALSGESSAIEHASHRSGLTFDLQIGPYRDDAGEIVGVFSIARDITERKRIEAAARTSEARFQTAYEHAPVGMGLVGVDGRFVSVNPALTAITGYSRDQLLKRSPSDLTHPDDRDRGEDLMHDLMVGDLDSYHEEKRYIHADGHVIDIALDVALVRDADGTPLHTVGQVVDITERNRQAADRERQLALTQQAREQLAEQNARLRELDRLKDEFVALVSHELRTPLTSMAAYLEPLIDEEAGPLTPTQDRFLKTIERNTQRLATIVGDLLFLASVDAGKLTIQPTSVDLAAVVADAGEAAAPVARNRGVALIVEPGEIRAIQADRARLAQLTDNLVSNAIKFTPEGGRVELRGRADATHAIVEVSDTGIGIHEDEIPQLFTRFFRAESATVHSISGTGLGLAIAKSIADAHHGLIEVDSKLGVGTTMRLRLPLDGNGD